MRVSHKHQVMCVHLLATSASQALLARPMGLRVPNLSQVEDLLEEGSVVARPIRLTGQYIRDVIGSDVTYIWIRIVSLSIITF